MDTNTKGFINYVNISDNFLSSESFDLIPKIS